MRASEFINEKVAFDTSNMRLVRVQPDLRGIGRDNNGVFLYRYGDNSKRNTIHFAINGVVGSHEMGNWDKAGVVIIADPKQVQGQMAGAKLEDTWYHVDENGRLYIGDPVILVPSGIDNPEKLPVKQYSGDRNTAVTEYLKSVGINALNIGRNSVADIDYDDTNDTVKDIISKYGVSGETTIDSHLNTIESSLEGVIARCRYQIEKAQKESWYGANDSGQEIERTEVVKDIISNTMTKIDNYVKTKPTIAKRAGPYLQKIQKELQSILQQQIPELEKQYEQSGYSFLMPDGSRTPAKTREDIMKSALTYAQTYPQYINHVHVVKNWPHEGKPYEDWGPISQVYSKQIRSLPQRPPAMPPPINQQMPPAMPPPINQQRPPAMPPPIASQTR